MPNKIVRLPNKIVRLNQQECSELAAWLKEQSSVEIEPDYREIIFRRGTAIELRMTLVDPVKPAAKPALEAVPEK